MIFRQSVRFALEGLRYIYRHERNFRIQLALAGAAIVLSVFLRISSVQWLFIITAIASVLALELINTVFEKVVDMFQPRVHHYAAVIKDLMAAAVVIASLSALLIGAIVFIPLIVSKLF